MNADYDPPSEPAEDPLVDEAIAYLKRLEPPLETRINNRVVVADELKALLATSQPRAWWRRSISVPVPVAAGLAAIVTLAFSLSFHASRERVPAPVTRPEPRASGPVEIASGKPIEAPGGGDSQPDRQYHAKETYLCGLGRLRFESGNFPREQSR